MNKDYMLYDICTNNSNDFVGIRIENNKLKINFPLGYEFNQNKYKIRKDIILLIKVINKYKKLKGKNYDNILNDLEQDYNEFPLNEYLLIIEDFLNNGYYNKKINIDNKTDAGKINWKNTIKKIKPYIENDELYYLKYICNNTINSKDNKITEVHKWIVYESFLKLGWLFTENLPDKPFISYNYTMFKKIILLEKESTFNDIKLKILNAMLNILEYYSSNFENRDIFIGVNKFEYIWEFMINNIFGIENKKEYLPKTQWYIEKTHHKFENNYLYPDTIMIKNNSIYILDSKYYKYGITKNVNNLPNSSDIIKQISYGKYIKNKFDNKNIYNIFIIPGNLNSELFEYIGYALEENNKPEYLFEYIITILVDIKKIMNIFLTKDNLISYELCNFIEEKTKNIVVK